MVTLELWVTCRSSNRRYHHICEKWFFLLPSGIIVACGVVKRFDEPLVSAVMNVCIRAPGILVANLLLWNAVLDGSINPPRIAWALQLALAPTNAVYYAHQAWSRFARRRKKIERDV